MGTIKMKLDFGRRTDSELDDYTQEKIDKLTGNPFYPPAGAFPELAAVTVKLPLYRNALAKALDGTKADTAFKKQQRFELEELLTKLAIKCMQIADGNEAIFLSSGFEISVRAATLLPLPAPSSFKLLEGGNEGELLAHFKRVEDNHGYEVWLSLTPVMSAATVKVTGSKTKILITGLQSGKKYYGWVRAIGPNNSHGNWSDVAAHIPQ